ncbi:NepR family anti-sigma factor [Elioraea sp.]|uniref:NepR family anti-sigma factor n=1 Tax=Elioraea sp. TaxID=2185103 RepID=UPI0025BCD96E|nr:NepR family anti-sigma factor [Elioraea sp.]
MDDQGGPDDKAMPTERPVRRERRAKPEAAFDLWLERGLRAMYDGVAQEPVPEALRRLIEADRKK